MTYIRPSPYYPGVLLWITGFFANIVMCKRCKLYTNLHNFNQNVDFTIKDADWRLCFFEWQQSLALLAQHAHDK